MRIIGPPSADRGLVLDLVMNTLRAHIRFGESMFAPLWDAAVAHSIDPVGVIAQSYKETAGGAFTGRVQPWFHNTAGIKVRDVTAVMRTLGTTDFDHPLVHAQFANWEVGALAQVQHLRAYAGWPVTGTIVDPRYHLVRGKRVENWVELGGVGSWAPSPTYGADIEATMRRLQGRP